jgi:plasmid stability protein
MAVSLSIKDVPERLARQLRARAARNHRSLRGELMAILEEALSEGNHLTPREVLERVRGLDLRTGSEAVRMVREDRDAR